MAGVALGSSSGVGPATATTSATSMYYGSPFVGTHQRYLESRKPVEVVTSLEFCLFNHPAREASKVQQHLEKKRRQYRALHGAPVYGTCKVISAKETRCLAASVSGEAILNFVTWLHEEYGESCRPADGDGTPALYVHPGNPRDNDSTPAVVAIVRQALCTVQWATTQVQLETERADIVSQQEQRSASLGRRGSQSVGSFSGSHAEE